MWSRLALFAAPVALVAACSGAPADSISSGLPEEQAACFDAAMIEALGPDALAVDAELTPARLEAMFEATTACRLRGAGSISVTERVGFGELQEQDLNNDIEAMSVDDVADQADRVGKNGGYLTEEESDLRHAALDDLILGSQFTLEEAQCIVDFMFDALGKRGLDFATTVDAEVVATDTDARAACT